MRARVLFIALSLLLAGIALLPTASAAAPCQHVGAGNTYAEAGTCGVTVQVKPYDCIMGGHWTTYTVGPITYRSYSCGPETS